MKRTVIACAIMLFSFVFLKYVHSVEDVPLKQPLSNFPLKIQDWTGKPDRFDQKVYDILGVDDSFLADYVSPDGRSVNLYIGFYQSQREGDIIHSPKNCMPGGGWNVVDESTEEIAVAGGNDRSIRVKKLILQHGDRKMVALYWYQAGSRVISSEYSQKIFLVIDSILRHRTDGSFIRLLSAPGVDVDEASKYLKDFAVRLLPVLEEYLPS